MRQDELQLLQRSFPSLDILKIIILEEGRRPSSSAFALSLLLAGGALSLLGAGFFRIPGRPKVAPRDLEETLAPPSPVRYPTP